MCQQVGNFVDNGSIIPLSGAETEIKYVELARKRIEKEIHGILKTNEQILPQYLAITKLIL